MMIQVMPFTGHVAPLEAVAQAFAEAGHAVRVYTGRAHAARFERAGARTVPWRRAPDFDEHDLEASFPRLRGRKGPLQMLRNVEDLFIGTGPSQCADLLDAFAEEPWDVLLGDDLSLGTVFAAERTWTPRVTVAIVPLAVPSRELPPPGLGLRPAGGALGRVRDAVLRAAVHAATGPIRRAYARARAEAGLPPGDEPFELALYSPELVCASGLPELEYPRAELPGHVVHVGVLARTAEAADPAWWPAALADPRPIVHVTQGTQNVDPDDLIRPAVAALGRQRVQLAIATGRADAGLPFPVPPNARVAGLLPYDRLLPRTDVVITNGGWGGVLAALAAGVPLVVAGGDLDKPEIAARVAWAGAGVDLRTGRPRPLAVLAAWRRVSGDPGYRRRARELAAKLAEHDGPAEVVALTMELLSGRRTPRSP